MIAWEVSCALLILVALALRAAFRKKLSATARYALWAVVLLRLLLPMSIGRARVSVPGALERVSARLEDSEAKPPLRDPGAFDSADVHDDDVRAHETRSDTLQPDSGQRETVTSGAPDKPAQAAAPVTVPWTEVVRFAWIAGAAAVALWFSYVNLHLARTLRRARRSIASDGPLPVYEAPGAETPCLFGLLRPAVYLPPEAAADEALRRYAVAHELTHYRHRDHLWAALRCLCLALHWWDPLVWAAAACSRRDAELACDEGTLVRLGASERRPYGEALIRMTVPEKSYLLRAATMMSGADLRERIKMIAHSRKTVRAALVVAVALLALAAVFVFAGNAGGNSLFDKAAPDHSAMTLYRLDESGGRVWNLYDSAKEKEILSQLKKVDAVPAEYLVSEALFYPLYGLEIGTRIGDTTRVLWSDGNLIDWKGKVYGFEFPFGSLMNDDWQPVRSIESAAELPNGAYLAQTGGKWLAERLTPAREANQALPDGLSMTVAQITDQAVTVMIENSGSETWRFGDPYSFDVLLDGAWYQVPLRPGDRNIGFNEIMWTLEPGNTVECACSLSYYAPLPPGVYRVEKSGLTARFALFADGTGTPVEIDDETPPGNSQADALRNEDRTPVPPDPSSLQTLQQSDPARFTALMQAWSAQVDMIGEQFVSEAGEAGDWWDVRDAFACRWCEKYAGASADSPYACFQSGIWELGTRLDCISLTGAPRRMAFNVALILSARNETAFVAARAGWAEKAPDGRLLISTEAVLVSDDDIHWTVEAMNTGGSAGWGWRHLPSGGGDYMETVFPYVFTAYRQWRDAEEYGCYLLQYLPNLDWKQLSAERFNDATVMLRAAALKSETPDLGENDQLYRDLYMLWGFKNADGAYAELFLGGPDSLLAVQYRADPETFAAALAEMDAHTRETVRLALGMG